MKLAPDPGKYSILQPWLSCVKKALYLAMESLPIGLLFWPALLNEKSLSEPGKSSVGIGLGGMLTSSKSCAGKDGTGLDIIGCVAPVSLSDNGKYMERWDASIFHCQALHLESFCARWVVTPQAVEKSLRHCGHLGMLRPGKQW